jgi:hypothetical protein
MRLRLLSLALALGLVSTLIVAPLAANAAAPKTANPLSGIPMSGSTAGGGTFTGALSVTNFAVQNGHLVANGVFNGTITDPTLAGGVPQAVTNVPVTLPAVVSGTCQMLNLILGRLDVNPLGLMVHLNQVQLNITAQQGPGNLLGNLLCAVANLLNGSTSGTALNQVVNLLNQILAAL